jgi:hypothetical protein
MPVYFIILTVVIYKYSNRHTPKGSARCVQNFDDSLDFAIRITYRISLRSSSIKEPRHPLLKVFFIISLLISFKTVVRSMKKMFWLRGKQKLHLLFPEMFLLFNSEESKKVW